MQENTTYWNKIRRTKSKGHHRCPQ